MAKHHVRLPTLTCKRCGYRWIPRVSRPGACPSCHSPHWDEPPTATRGGRPRKR